MRVAWKTLEFCEKQLSYSVINRTASERQNWKYYQKTPKRPRVCIEGWIMYFLAHVDLRVLEYSFERCSVISKVGIFDICRRISTSIYALSNVYKVFLLKAFVTVTSRFDRISSFLSVSKLEQLSYNRLYIIHKVSAQIQYVKRDIMWREDYW